MSPTDVTPIPGRRGDHQRTMTAALLYDLRERLQAADELLDELHNGDDRWPQSAALVATLDQIQERAEALKASGYGVR